LIYNLFLNRFVNLIKFVSFSYRLIVLNIKFWSNNITSPIPNSIAEKIKKNKVSDSMFKLSYIKPTNNERQYNVIHNNSAVNNKCKEVFTLIKTEKNKIKKNKINKFKSPINIKKTN